jgi:type I restriction enzyme R subunit
MADRLTAWLHLIQGCGYSQVIAERAVFELVKVAGNYLQQGLYKANQDVLFALKYGAKVHENPGDPDKTVYSSTGSIPRTTSLLLPRK